jgi:hypothetical protein
MCAKERAIYIPGNHDEWLRDYTQLQFGGVEVLEQAIHVTADGPPVAGDPRRCPPPEVTLSSWRFRVDPA